MIPDSCEEICAKSFKEWESLSRVTSGESSSLKRIGIEAFRGSGLEEIHIRTVLKNFVTNTFTDACVFHVLHLVNARY